MKIVVFSDSHGDKESMKLLIPDFPVGIFT